jgi:hypothetical protein
MTRGAKVRRGVVVLSVVVAGVAGCAAGRPAERVSRAAPPARLEIPAIGVSTPLVRLGLLVDGSMEVPRDYGVAGWFTGGPQPGQLGPAVIAGHVDSKTGPAVFYRPRDLRPGDQIRVARVDGRVVRFEVESLARYPKREFPDKEVFGATTDPALRLITCAGDFDRSQCSDLDNLMVSAVRVRDGAGGSGSGGAAGR